MAARLQEFQKVLKRNSLGGFIVTNPFNIQYLTDFKGIYLTEREAILAITKNEAALITARLYQAEAKKLASTSLKIKIAAERNEIDGFIKESLKGAKAIGFEETDLKYAEFVKFKKLLKYRNNQSSQIYSSNPSMKLRINFSEKSNRHSSRLPASNNIKLIATKNLIENLRIIKSEDEIRKIEKAQKITQAAFEEILPTLKAGQTELEIAHTLKSILLNLGTDGLAFEPIIASGPNSGKPHHVTGNRQLTIKDTLLFDFGAKYQNYCADFSRTVFIGKASDIQRNIYTHVLTAQKKALRLIKHGINNHEPFHAANNHFKENKLDNYFLHSLGHGIGLEVHESPHLRSKTVDHQSTNSPLRKRSEASHQQLTNGMVFSVEPGLYFPWGGVRIEDLVTIKNGRVKVLGKITEGIILL